VTQTFTFTLTLTLTIRTRRGRRPRSPSSRPCWASTPHPGPHLSSHSLIRYSMTLTLTIRTRRGRRPRSPSSPPCRAWTPCCAGGCRRAPSRSLLAPLVLVRWGTRLPLEGPSRAPRAAIAELIGLSSDCAGEAVSAHASTHKHTQAHKHTLARREEPVVLDAGAPHRWASPSREGGEDGHLPGLRVTCSFCSDANLMHWLPTQAPMVYIDTENKFSSSRLAAMARHRCVCVCACVRVCVCVFLCAPCVQGVWRACACACACACLRVH